MRRARDHAQRGGDAAALAKNSVGSAQVKPNSLNGTDIKESSLKGVVLGTGSARAGTRRRDRNRVHDGVHDPEHGAVRMDCAAAAGRRRTSGSATRPARTRSSGAPRRWHHRRHLPRHGARHRRPDHLGDEPRPVVLDLVHPLGWAGPGPITQVQVASDTSGTECFSHFISVRRHALIVSGGHSREGRVRLWPPWATHESGARVKGLRPGSLPDRASSPGTRRLDRRVAQVRRRRADSFAKLRCRERRDGRVVRQRPAKPRTPVRIRFAPYAVAAGYVAPDG